MQYLISASLIWAFSYGLIKTELTSLDPNFVTFCRMLAAFIVFLPFLKFKKNRESAPFLFLVGAVQYGLMYLFVLRSYQYLDAWQVVFFTCATPFYVILINAMFIRKLTIFHFIVSLTAVMGGLLLYEVPTMNSKTFLGFVLVQAADLCFSFGQISYKYYRQKNPQLNDKDIYGFLFIGAMVISVISTTWFDGWHSLHDITLRQGMIVGYLGAIASGVCFFWWNKGALITNPLTLSVFNNLKLPLATIVSIVCFHEQVKDGMRLGCGLTVMILTLFLAEMYQRKQNETSIKRGVVFQ